jgi:excisionase family DNA binding protein
MSSNPKKYLSLEEAAARLSVTKDQLIKMRETGEIRGFADRGTWKFRQEDVDEVARTRQSDSNPDVPMFGDSGPMVIGDELAESGSSTILSEGLSGVEDDPTVIRKGSAGAASDSDVKLVGADSDSDITLAPGRDPASSDSDVKLIPEPASDSSDSDVQLIDPAAAGEDSSDSDVALIGGQDSTVALDLLPDDSEQASVLSDDSGLALDSGSSLTLAADSGISLEADEGITLDVGSDSGISLEGIGDSGISLEDSDEFGGTVPMMDAVPQAESVEETKFEIPAMQDDSAFDLKMKSGADDTGVLDLGDSGQQSLDDAVFDVDEDTGEEDELEVSADILGEDDELEDLDIFDADEGLFEESGASQEFAPPVAGRAMAVEQEWGGGVVASLAVSFVLMAVATIISFDLVRSMWQASGNDSTPITSAIIGMFGGG